jgi:hypothetical protein
LVFKISTLIESRGMGWVGHIARMGDVRGAYRLLMGDRKEKVRKTWKT